MTTNIQNTTDLIAITSREGNFQSEVCEQFGRAYWLMVFNPTSGSWYAIDNGLNRTRIYGVGIATAEAVIRSGARVVLTGETGPKAFRTLNAAGISIVHNVGGTVEETLQDWLSGRLSLAYSANDPGNPNCLMGQNSARDKSIGKMLKGSSLGNKNKEEFPDSHSAG